MCFVTIKADIYHRDRKVGRLEIENGKLIKNECYTSDIFEHPCARAKTVMDVLSMLAERVLPPCRCDEWLLSKMGLKEYNVWKIFKINHGINGQDFIWFKFDDDRQDLSYEDVRVR